MLDAAGHRLEVALPEQPIVCHADPLRLAQVLSNLLSNAIKYTPPRGTITLKARLEDGGTAVVSVKDTGIGIEPAQIDRMFEMFAHGQPATDRAQGLGIGLALVKNIVELHGGRVEASSAGPGQGSEFRILLPGQAAPAAAPAALAKNRGLS